MQTHLLSTDALARIHAALRREDPTAEVRLGADPAAIEVASAIPPERVSAILREALGTECAGSCRDDDRGDAESDACCGCCG